MSLIAPNSPVAQIHNGIAEARATSRNRSIQFVTVSGMERRTTTSAPSTAAATRAAAISSTTVGAAPLGQPISNRATEIANTTPAPTNIA